MAQNCSYADGYRLLSLAEESMEPVAVIYCFQGEMSSVGGDGAVQSSNTKTDSLASTDVTRGKVQRLALRVVLACS